ncbi:MAG: TIGR03619 family F420-dependent LLM class oxidoreductase, partial [Myxococcota bacterium]
LAPLAESLGYDSVWVSEHLFHASYVAERLGDRPYHEALTVLAAAGAATSRVRLGTSVLVLPWHHPVRLAKTVATIDALSRGRVVLGVGVGAAPDEYAALGVRYEERGAICDEMLDAMVALWAEGTPDFQGKRYAFSGLPFAPKPAQKPHPPLWIGGSSPAALRRVIRIGDGWHPLGLSPAQLGEGMQTLRKGLQAAGRSPELPVAVRVVLQFADAPWDRPPEERRSCRGTPDELAAVIRAYEAAGATELILDANTPDLARTRESMKRFLDEVAPAYVAAGGRHPV